MGRIRSRGLVEGSVLLGVAGRRLLEISKARTIPNSSLSLFLLLLDQTEAFGYCSSAMPTCLLSSKGSSHDGHDSPSETVLPWPQCLFVVIEKLLRHWVSERQFSRSHCLEYVLCASPGPSSSLLSLSC